MNKTKKVLSIILITFLILSTIFTLCKNVGLCASDSDNSIPFNAPPFLVGEGIGPYDVYSRSLVLDIVDDAISRSGNSSSPLIILPYRNYIYAGFLNSTQPTFNLNGFYVYYSLCYEYAGDDGHYISEYTNGQLGIETGVYENVNGQDIYKSTSFGYNYPVYILNLENYTFTSGSLVFAYSSNSSNSPGFNNNFWENYQDSVDDLDNNNSIWKPNYSNPSNQQGFWDNVIDFFNRSFKSLLGGISAGVKTIGDFIGQALDRLEGFLTTLFESFYGWIFDFLDDLLGDIKDNTDDLATDTHNHYQWQQGFFTESGSSNISFWDYLDEHLIDTLEDFTENIWGHLPDFMKAPYRIAMWFYQHGLKNGEFDFLTLWEYLFDFDSQTAYNLWSSNKYGDFILDVRGFFADLISSITGVTASDRVFFTISLGDHFGVPIPDIEIDFSWYASIRDQFLPYLMAFLYVSVLWLFFKRLPDILKGVAGAESSFADNLPHEFTNVSTDSDTHTITFTQGTRSRSGTTSSISRMKY